MHDYHQYENEDWMLAEKESIAAKIEAGFAQAERGELIDSEQAIQILRERRAKRRTG
jgi:predicted transcriptional regulator